MLLVTDVTSVMLDFDVGFCRALGVGNVSRLMELKVEQRTAETNP